MALVLRQMGIPSRFVYGYLPGIYQPSAGTWSVEQVAFHNWVEVFFPGIGWVRFDPTPGDDFGREATNLRQWQSRPEATEEPDVEPIDEPEDELDPSPEPSFAPLDTGVLPTDGGDDTVALVISGGALVLLLLSVTSLLLLYRLRRLPDGDGSLAYRGVVSLATRLGYPPHPSQTEYEYAGTLSQALPTVRDDLYVVAGARVEAVYGARHLERERRGPLRRAYARVRTALVRRSLRFRRRGR
jgi:hypothetical protein